MDHSEKLWLSVCDGLGSICTGLLRHWHRHHFRLQPAAGDHYIMYSKGILFSGKHVETVCCRIPVSMHILVTRSRGKRGSCCLSWSIWFSPSSSSFCIMIIDLAEEFAKFAK